MEKIFFSFFLACNSFIFPTTKEVYLSGNSFLDKFIYEKYINLKKEKTIITLNDNNNNINVFSFSITNNIKRLTQDYLIRECLRSSFKIDDKYNRFNQNLIIDSYHKELNGDNSPIKNLNWENMNILIINETNNNLKRILYVKSYNEEKNNTI